MDNNDTSSAYDQYHADIQSIIDCYTKSVDNYSPNKLSQTYLHSTSTPSKEEEEDICTLKKYRNQKFRRHLISNASVSSLITFDRDPAISENLTDDFRWLLIQYGPCQPRDAEDHFVGSTKSTNNGKGIGRFRVKWFDDVRFSDWLEYSLTTCRAYCFCCRLFVDSSRNRAFSRDGVKNWRKCLGSRGQKKKRSTKISNEDTIGCQRRGLLESHAMSESHKHAYIKYLAFIDQKHHVDRKQDSNTNVLQDI